MSQTTNHVTTAAQLAAMPDDGNRYELVNGVLHMMSPAGFRHGRIAAKLIARLTIHAELHDLGATLAAETGFLVSRNPDTVLAPDASFVSRDRLKEFIDLAGYLPLAPDLVAEVLSPGDRWPQVERKVAVWLDAGVRCVLVVDPQAATIREYRPGESCGVYTDGFIDLTDVLPGFQLDVADLFA